MRILKYNKKIIFLVIIILVFIIEFIFLYKSIEIDNLIFNEIQIWVQDINKYKNSISICNEIKNEEYLSDYSIRQNIQCIAKKYDYYIGFDDIFIKYSIEYLSKEAKYNNVEYLTYTIPLKFSILGLWEIEFIKVHENVTPKK